MSIFIFDASDNQVLMNKNYHQIKTLKKDTNKLLEKLDDLKSIYSNFSEKIVSTKFFNFESENIVFKNISEKIKKIDLEDEETLSDYIQLNFYNNN